MTYYPPAVMIPINSILMGIGVVLLGIRFWVRLAVLPRETRGLRIDDYLAVAGVLLTASCTGLQLWTAIDGTDGNVTNSKTDVNRKIVHLKVGDIQPFIEPIALGAIKCSFVFFYRGIFWVVPKFDRISMISICIIVAWAAAFFIAELSICGTKLPLLWNPNQDLAAKHCGDKGALLLVFALTSVLTDILVLTLPIMGVRAIQVQKRKRWGMYGIFFLGGASTIACFLRLIFLCAAYHYGTLKLQNSAANQLKIPNFFNAFNPSFWITIEMWTGSWASNLITMGPLLAIGCWSGRKSTKPSFASTGSSAYSEAIRKYELDENNEKSSTSHPAGRTDFVEYRSDEDLMVATPLSDVSHPSSPSPRASRNDVNHIV